MDISFYDIGNIYKKRVLLKEEAPITDVQNSYQTTASMSGPGHGQYNAGIGDNAHNDTLMKLPEGPLTTEQKRELLKKFLQSEIDGKQKIDGDPDWKQNTKQLFKQLYANLLDDGDLSQDDQKKIQDFSQRKQDSTQK